MFLITVLFLNVPTIENIYFARAVLISYRQPYRDVSKENKDPPYIKLQDIWSFLAPNESILAVEEQDKSSDIEQQPPFGDLN